MSFTDVIYRRPKYDNIDVIYRRPKLSCEVIIHVMTTWDDHNIIDSNN